MRPLSKFGKCTRARDGLVGTCNGCAYARKRRDLEKERARKKRWRKANRARHLEHKQGESRRRRRRAAEAEGREFWTQAQRDGLLASDVDPARLAVTTDALLCADTMVHLSRTHGWDAATYVAWLGPALRGLVTPQR